MPDDHATLEPIEPNRAIEMYLRDRQDELAESTIEMHEHHLSYVVEWCQDEGVGNLNDLTGRDLYQYGIHLKRRGLSRATRRTHLSSLRVFLRWAARIEAVPEDLAEKVDPPTLTPEDRRDRMVDGETATQVLDYLDTYEYASRKHAIFRVLFRTAMRMGAARGLDVGDYDPDQRLLRPRHRPEQDTPLKNGAKSERAIALTEKTCEVLDNYIRVNRWDVTDEYGRRPLFTSQDGRIGKTAFRRTVYAATRPCKYANECPHDTEPLECTAARRLDDAYECPSSKSPHPVRRGSITWHLLNDTPETVVADRCDLGEDVMERHYDQRTEEEQAAARREFVESLD